MTSGNYHDKGIVQGLAPGGDPVSSSPPGDLNFKGEYASSQTVDKAVNDFLKDSKTKSFYSHVENVMWPPPYIIVKRKIIITTTVTTTIDCNGQASSKSGPPKVREGGDTYEDDKGRPLQDPNPRSRSYDGY
jgi:hypothetical protein